MQTATSTQIAEAIVEVMIEFHRIAEERQCEVIKGQATRIIRQQRTIQRLCLLVWALSVAALLALASDLGWLA